jgi:hypothetical protein
MYFGGDGTRISHRMEVLRGYEWRMRMLWMLILRQNRSRKQIISFSTVVIETERYSAKKNYVEGIDKFGCCR